MENDKKTEEDLQEHFGKPPNKTKFRLLNQRIALTYNSGHINKDEYKEWFSKQISSYKSLHMAHEIGSETNRKHTHVLIDFDKRFDTTNQRKFDYDENHPNIRKVTTDSHWDNWIKYLKKQDPDNITLKTKKTITDKVWECDGLKTALDKNARSLSDINAVVTLYGLKPLKTAKTIEPNREWQQEILKKLHKEPHPRRITWVYDKYGNSGKSALCKYLMVTNPESHYLVTQMGGLVNFATIIQTAMQSRWNGRVMLIDLARDAQDKAIYEPLECLKNGVITATKYRGSTMIFDNPHVVVFANFEPIYKKMTKDRWTKSIVIINKDNKTCHVENGSDDDSANEEEDIKIPLEMENGESMKENKDTLQETDFKNNESIKELQKTLSNKEQTLNTYKDEIKNLKARENEIKNELEEIVIYKDKLERSANRRKDREIKLTKENEVLREQRAEAFMVVEDYKAIEEGLREALILIKRYETRDKLNEATKENARKTVKNESQKRGNSRVKYGSDRSTG